MPNCLLSVKREYYASGEDAHASFQVELEGGSIGLLSQGFDTDTTTTFAYCLLSWLASASPEQAAVYYSSCVAGSAQQLKS